MRLLTLRTVVVATDLDASSHAALHTARALAAQSGAALHVVHAIAPGSPERSATSHDEITRSIRELLGPSEGLGGQVGVHVIPGEPAETIRGFAHRIHADVIVVGPHRRGDSGGQAQPLGSTAHAIVEGAHAPCLIVRQPLRMPLTRVLVPSDLSDTARGALLVGLSWASGLRAPLSSHGTTTLTALHVEVGDEQARGEAVRASVTRELETLRGEGGRWAGIAVEERVEWGSDVAGTIAAYAHDGADLLVMGTRGRTGDGTGLGSVSMAVTLQVRTPTLLVPPGVWQAHIQADAL